MADAEVEFLLSNVKDLLVYHSHLITDTKSQIENLETDLRVLQALLKDLKGTKDERTQALVRNLRDVIWEAEDIIDAIVTQAAVNRTRSYFSRRAFKSPGNLQSIGKKVEEITNQIQQSRIDSASLAVTDDEDESKKAKLPPTRHSPFVRLEDEENEIIGYLEEDSAELDLIFIVGMSGIGKTALAWKVYKDVCTRYIFPVRIWVNVSQEFSEREVFHAILTKLISRFDITEKDDHELGEIVADSLQGTKFLIVLDDVVTAHDLKRLLNYLPKNNKKSKVLITCRNEQVIRDWRANASRPPVRKRFLTQSESWSLLRLEVFGSGECPPELESIGRLIADQCDGLPLAIRAIADALMRAHLSSSDIGGQRIAWTRVCSRVPKYINDIFYLDLPEHLRLIFLYMGMFPQDFDIPVWKLTRMWIAEGFITRTQDFQNLEEKAESFLQDLIARNLVVAGEIKSDGKLKTCRIHRMLHEHCRSQNESESFIKQIEFTEGTSYSDLSKYRRLCIYSKFFNFLLSKPVFPLARSFVAFNFDKVHLTPENSSLIPAGFKRVRVLDVPITFTKIPADMYQLIHLRFLVLSFDSAILPAQFSKLWNIQTLILDTKSPTLEIKADIWQFTQLRHLKTNVCTTLTTGGGKHTTSSSKEGANLQTLGTVSAESCTKELFDRAHDLKKLGIRGKLYLFLDEKIGSFHHLGKLSYLETLKLRNDSSSESQLHGLPEHYKFPPNLRSLTLAHTCLDWEHMRTLSFLKGLQVLKLKDNAFVGNIWSTVNGGFDSLEALHIGRTDLVNWVASPEDFPKLKTLKLHHCEKLREVPIQLAYIPRLQHLELFHTKVAAPSAIRIREDIKNPKYEQGTSKITREFKLSIFPSIE